MGKKLEKFKKDNFENMKIGFLLELGFKQEEINLQLKNFIEFLKENKEFLKNVDLYCLTESIENFSDLFLNFTDVIYKDVDFNEIHCKYHKKFF